MKENKKNDPHSKATEGLMELAAIWLNVSINGTKRIKSGDLICIEDGWLLSGDYATHKIIACYGDIHSTTLKIMVTDILTNEPSFLKLK